MSMLQMMLLQTRLDLILDVDEEATEAQQEGHRDIRAAKMTPKKIRGIGIGEP